MYLGKDGSLAAEGFLSSPLDAAKSVSEDVTL